MELLAPIFRGAAQMYDENTGEMPYFAGDGELIGTLFQEDWRTFSDTVEESGNLQEICTTILKAGLHPKDDVDDPDYDGLYWRTNPLDFSIDQDWEERIHDLLSHPPPPPTAEEIPAEPRLLDVEEMPDRLEYVIAELGRRYDAGTVLYRARIHSDRTRHERFAVADSGHPPAAVATAGRANRANEPVLYVATDDATAVAEVRPWRNAPVALGRIRLRNDLRILDLTNFESLESPFFHGGDVAWLVEAHCLMARVRQDLMRPVAPHESAAQYTPSQYACELMRAAGFQGVAYPSAMGDGTNVAIFDLGAYDVLDVRYVRVSQVRYPFAPEDADQIEVDDFPYG